MLLGMLSSVAAGDHRSSCVGGWTDGGGRPPERLHNMTDAASARRRPRLTLENLEDEIDEIIRKEVAKSGAGRGRCGALTHRAGEPARISDRPAPPFACAGAAGP